MDSNAKALVGLGAIAAIGAVYYFTKSSARGNGAVDLGGSTIPPSQFDPVGFPDPNLSGNQIASQSVTGGNPAVCGCGGDQTQTFYVDNSALSASLNNMYDGFAANYYAGIQSSMPKYFTQYFNNVYTNQNITQ